MLCTVRDVPIYYETYGSGTPVLLLHGLPVDHRLMTNSLEPFFENQPGWQRIYLDLPGMGQTPGHEQMKHSDAILEMLLEFIDAVIPDQQFLLVGESYGAYLSRGIVLRRFEQVAGMALICPGIVMEMKQRDLSPQTILLADPDLMASLPPKFAYGFAQSAVIQSKENWDLFEKQVISGFVVADFPYLESFQNSYAFSFDVDALLPQAFEKPVAIIAGRQDNVVGYRDAWRILEHYPRATFAVLDRAGHNLQIEQMPLMHSILGEWLTRVQEAMH